MKITVLNGSPRKNGNTETMVDAFVQGVQEAGHEAEVIPVGRMNIHGCLGCKYCHSHNGTCVQKDDMSAVLASIDRADMVVFASPIYWFDLTAQMKAVIDRMYARGSVGFHFNKVALFLNSGADGVYDAAVTQYRMMYSYLKWDNVGIITVPNMTDINSMKESPAVDQIYEFGKRVSAD